MDLSAPCAFGCNDLVQAARPFCQPFPAPLAPATHTCAGSGEVAARPGILRLMEEAQAAGVPVAVCSAATKGAVVFVLDNLLGKERFAALDLFMAGDDVKEKKPNPLIYQVGGLLSVG